MEKAHGSSGYAAALLALRRVRLPLRIRLARTTCSKKYYRSCDAKMQRSRHGTCTRTHRPHQLLQGIQPSTGRFYTIVAEPYPRRLCRRLVEAFAQSFDRRNRLHPVCDIWAGKFRKDGYETFYGKGNDPVATDRLPCEDLGGEGYASRLKCPPACAPSRALHLQSGKEYG